MTLGEFRRYTSELPDNTILVANVSNQEITPEGYRYRELLHVGKMLLQGQKAFDSFIEIDLVDDTCEMDSKCVREWAQRVSTLREK